jgi:hypothetical protein
LLSHGIEDEFQEGSIENLCNVLVLREASWIETLQLELSLIPRVKDDVKHLFNMIIPISVDQNVIIWLN